MEDRSALGSLGVVKIPVALDVIEQHLNLRTVETHVDLGAWRPFEREFERDVVDELVQAGRPPVIARERAVQMVALNRDLDRLLSAARVMLASDALGPFVKRQQRVRMLNQEQGTG